MWLYRICRAPYAALDVQGARLYGGRWNRPGRAVVYGSTTLSLAALEYLVHVDPQDVPTDLMALTIVLPDDVARPIVDLAALPTGWEQLPAHPACQDIGDQWLVAGVQAVLEVPSAAVPEERNLLINPRHPDATRMKVLAQRPFGFDPRLLR